jgi:hypothetical protein
MRCGSRLRSLSNPSRPHPAGKPWSRLLAILLTMILSAGCEGTRGVQADSDRILRSTRRLHPLPALSWNKRRMPDGPPGMQFGSTVPRTRDPANRDVRGFSENLFPETPSVCLSRYPVRSGKSPGIQRDASVAGKARRSGARLLSDSSTPRSISAETTRRAWRSPVPMMPAASPRGSSPR